MVVQLADGVLTDDQGRTGYIASNFQFQFDDPPQSGALYTAGFSVCTNGSLALGSSATFWQCASGTFYNLYDRWSAAQCSPVDILVLPCGSGGENGNGQDATQTVVGTRIITTTLVVPLGDGQPQVITTTTLVPICQINDGTFCLPPSTPPHHPIPTPSPIPLPLPTPTPTPTPHLTIHPLTQPARPTPSTHHALRANQPPPRLPNLRRPSASDARPDRSSADGQLSRRRWRGGDGAADCRADSGAGSDGGAAGGEWGWDCCSGCWGLGLGRGRCAGCCDVMSG